MSWLPLAALPVPAFDPVDAAVLELPFELQAATTIAPAVNPAAPRRNPRLVLARSSRSSAMAACIRGKVS